MGNWLQNVRTLVANKKPGTRLLASKDSNLPAQPPGVSLPPSQNLPNATIIYGIGASLMFAAAAVMLVHGRWFSALIVLAVGACLTGFALHLLKHQD